MTPSKIFVGSKLRRLRAKSALSQASFAQALGISASYLNLMERDQRPLTAQVVLRLSQMEGVDVAELSAGEAAHALLQPLREMASDPLLIGEVPPGNELSEVLQAAPNFAAASLKLYGTYREQQKRLADAARGLPPAPREEDIEDWLARRSNDDLEGLAEDIHADLSPKDDVFAGLKAALRAHAGIDCRIMPITIIGADRSRYDRHSQRLLISETIGFEQRIFEAAHLLAQLTGRDAIATATSFFRERPEQQRVAIAALRDHLALAILAPRGRFTSATADLNFDAAALARRFSITQGRALERLAVLNDGMSYLCLSANGQLLKQHGKLPFHLVKDAPLCGQLPFFTKEHSAHYKPSQGPAFSCTTFRSRNVIHALFAVASHSNPRPFGSTCRLCDVKDCDLRSAAFAGRSPGLNDYVRGATVFEPN